LSYANPAASEDLISQNELGDWALATADPHELVCKGDMDKLPPDFTGATMAGMNMYPLLITSKLLKT
jgi:hypothetical protein